MFPRPHRLLLPGALFIIAGLAYAVEPRFSDSGQGVVLDRDTGLAWQKCSAGQVPADGLCQGDSRLVGWYEARELCEGMTLDQRVWRLPDARELFSIMDRSRTRPFLDLTFFSATYPFRYWAADYQIEEGGVMGEAVSYLDGHRFAEPRGRNFVRCVSSPQ
ncbi:MAG: DUF1566 domain-containing protein [Spirochaetales bacterium]|nr:DUF1566 domain-containing protein [Leptospiraceae bacterium]MCP5480810.1 DUF1566 domain-containing protein [Spirochaetales bacterium]